MKTFKEQMKDDLKNIFFNLSEFSDIHVVNGKEMAAQVDTNEQIRRAKRVNQNADGIYLNQKLIYVAADDFGPLPRQDSILKLDGKTYRVADAVDEYGVYSITIEANRAR